MENTIVDEIKIEGVDLIHSWSSVDEALESGRFNYLWDLYVNDKIDFHPDELHDCKSVQELIGIVGFPFFIK